MPTEGRRRTMNLGWWLNEREWIGMRNVQSEYIVAGESSNKNLTSDTKQLKGKYDPLQNGNCFIFDVEPESVAGRLKWPIKFTVESKMVCHMTY